MTEFMSTHFEIEPKNFRDLTFHNPEELVDLIDTLSPSDFLKDCVYEKITPSISGDYGSNVRGLSNLATAYLTLHIYRTSDRESPLL